MGGALSGTPSPTREVIEQALAALDGGPVTVGPLAFRVCEVMGVDTEGVNGSYELRSRMPWAAFQTELRGMVSAGVLVVRSRQEWHDLTQGALFPEVGHGANRAYATLSVALGIDAAVERRARSTRDPRRDRARQHAQARVLVENRATVERYVREWLEAHPE